MSSCCHGSLLVLSINKKVTQNRNLQWISSGNYASHISEIILLSINTNSEGLHKTNAAEKQMVTRYTK